MNLNPKHHNPALLEDIEEYYNENYEYNDYDEYDSCYMGDWDNSDYYCDPNATDGVWIDYVWLISQDRVVVGKDNVKNLDGCDMYEYEDGSFEYEIYIYGAYNKLEAFFSLIITVFKETNNPSEYIKETHETLIDRYPEVYFKLIGRL